MLLGRVENPVVYGCAAALSGLYFWERLHYDRVIAIYTWMIPFIAVTVIGKFVFAVLEHRAERRAEAERELPAARVVSKPAQPAPIAGAPPPPRPAPPASGDQPSLLR